MTEQNLTRRGIPAGLFVSDPRIADALRQKLAEKGIDVLQQTQGAFNWADMVRNTDFTQLRAVVAEIPASGDLIEAVSSLARRVDAGTSVVLLGREGSVVFYHQIRRAGATDYYPLTTPPEEVAAGVLATVAAEEAEEEEKAGRVVAVVGCGTGVGAATAATVLASGIARQEPVIVVDAGLQMPAVGSLLGVDVPGSLPQMLQAQDRLDAVLVNQSLVDPRKNIRLLDGYDPFLTGQRVTDCSRLVRELARQSPWQVWRIPAATSFTRSLLLEADCIIPVVCGTFPSMRAAQTLSSAFLDVKPSGKIWWVFNHRNPTDTVKPEEAAKSLNAKISAEIPFVKSLGEELVEPFKWLDAKNPFAKALAPVARALAAGSDPSASGTSFWSRLWK